MKWIDEKTKRFAFVAQQKVPGEVDAAQWQIQSPADLEKNDAECQRYPELAVENVVQKRIARIVIRFRVAAEPFLIEQQLADFVEHDWRRSLIVQPVLHLLGKKIEPVQVRLRHELRV